MRCVIATIVLSLTLSSALSTAADRVAQFEREQFIDARMLRYTTKEEFKLTASRQDEFYASRGTTDE